MGAGGSGGTAGAGGATTALVKVSRTGSMMPDGGVDGSVDSGSDTSAAVDAPTADGADTAAGSMDVGAGG